MSHLALASSTAALSANSTFLALAHATSHQPVCPNVNHGIVPFEFQAVALSPALVLFKQIPRFPIIRQALSVASYVYSKIPSWPVAYAATVPCDGVVCPTPIGTYMESCNRPDVTYLPLDEECELRTRCATFYEGLAHQPASFRFPPRSCGISLENHNGTLVVQRPREEALNAQLAEAARAALSPVALKKAQEAVIADFKAGDVLTIARDKLEVVLPENAARNNGAFKAFQRIAQDTGGIMGYSSSTSTLNPLLEKMFAHILKAAETSGAVDLAFVVDTTSSMRPYIEQVQKNLIQFLTELQGKIKERVAHFRVALLQFRDREDVFLNRVEADFTSDLKSVEGAVKQLRASGGAPDEPEAVLDALLAAKEKLHWNQKVKRIVVMIGDAPPHPKTADGRYDEAAVVAQYQAAGTQIAVYPIFALSKE